MERTGRYVLIAILAIAFLAVASWATLASFPCLSYPTAYFKTHEFGEKIEAFYSKHGRLPDPSSLSDTAELRLESGYTFSDWVDGYSYRLLISTDIDPEYKDQSLLPFKMGFDMPWVIYTSRTKAVSCGHR
jgi:hypothetical protein